LDILFTGSKIFSKAFRVLAVSDLSHSLRAAQTQNHPKGVIYTKSWLYGTMLELFHNKNNLKAFTF
jgi:hypothetical protein